MTQLNPNWIQALTYSARLDRQLIKATFSEGVLSGLKVSQRAAGAQMNVDIAAGVGVIYGDDQTDQGAYLVTCSVFETVTIGAAPGSNSRRDLVCWRVNDPNGGGPAGSTSSFVVVPGVASATPALPALPLTAIPIAEVLVSVGNVTVVDAMITNSRVPSLPNGAQLPGAPFPFFGPEALIPADCVLYNGQAVSRDTYWRIFAYLGTSHGAGNGTTTFNLPDMRGRTPFGLDNMGGVDAGVIGVANTLGLKGGAETVTLDVTMIPAHAHVHNPHSHVHNAHTHTQNAHSHGGQTAGTSTNHTHSGTTANESNVHSHSGTTDGQSADHYHTTQTRANYYMYLPPGGNNSPAFATATNQDTYGTSNDHNHHFDTQADNPGHVHAFTTGTESTQHVHAVNADTATNQNATATENAATSTEANIGGGLAHSNMPPFILCNWIAHS